tara:strand:- start:10191 stop:10877 length:687 start_codon:yes stop_codon:yes gene_type:complete
MNYVIEDNINFYDLLNNYKDESSENEKCLITNYALDSNFITLSCGHKFNYLPLYQETIRQKTVQNVSEVTRLKINQIKCPYCRDITNNLLPFINIENVEKIWGVNQPKKYSLTLFTCEYLYKSGKNKGQCCGKSAQKFDFGNFCNKHFKVKENKSKSCKPCKNCKTNNNDNNEGLILQDNPPVYEDKFEELKAKYSVKILKELLKFKKLKTTGNKTEMINRLIKINYF